MIKIWKIILIAITGIGFVGFLAIGYWYKTEGPAMAVDYNSNTEIMCEEPIPVGIAVDRTVDFLDDIYQRYQGKSIQDAAKQIDALMTDIGNGGKICDFNDPKNGCTAQVGTGGPDAKLVVDALIWKGSAKKTVPSCVKKEATGNPCPNLDKYTVHGKETSLGDLASSLAQEAENIHDLFNVANTPVPYGLAEGDEVVGETLITKVQEVKKYIKNIDDWLTPSPEKNTCALSELDRKRIEQGKMGDKYPMQCLEALHQEMYVPKAWSEKCQDECETFSQECKDCLAECKGDSVYASLNCKIYSLGNGKAKNMSCGENTNQSKEKCEKIDGCIWGNETVMDNDSTETCYATPQRDLGTDPKCAFIQGQSQKCCGAVCADGFNTACKECLCASTDKDKPLSQEQCLDWICGGSSSNWVCCHEEPITNPAYYIVDEIFGTGGDVESYISETGEKVYRITSGKQLTFGQAYSLFQKLTDSYLSDLNPIFLLANAYRESKFVLEAGQCTVNDPKTKLSDSDPNRKALQKIAQELGLDYTLVPLSCAGSVGTGGAMGPAQFMPTTWWNIGNNTGYKFSVEKKLGEKPANPWDFRDAFLASALYLHDEGARKDNEKSEKDAVQVYVGPKDQYSPWATMCYKKGFQELADAGCLDESGPKLPMCDGANKKLNKSCSKAQYALNKVIDTIIFWK